MFFAHSHQCENHHKVAVFIYVLHIFVLVLVLVLALAFSVSLCRCFWQHCFYSLFHIILQTNINYVAHIFFGSSRGGEAYQNRVQQNRSPLPLSFVVFIVHCLSGVLFSICLDLLSRFLASFHNESGPRKVFAFPCEFSSDISSCYSFCLFFIISAILHPKMMIELKQQGVVLIVCSRILLVFLGIFAFSLFHSHFTYHVYLLCRLTFLTFSASVLETISILILMLFYVHHLLFLAFSDILLSHFLLKTVKQTVLLESKLLHLAPLRNQR